MPAEWEPHEATWLGWPHERTDWPAKFAPIPWAFAEIVRHLARVERVFLVVENREAEAGARKILSKSGANLDAVTFFRIPTDRGWMRDSGPIAVMTARLRSGAELPHRPGVIPNPAAGFADGGEGSAFAMRGENKKQIPRTPSRAPGNQGGEESARDSARDDNKQAGAALLDFVFDGWARYANHKKDAKVASRAAALLKRNALAPEHNGRRIVLEGGAIDVNGCGSLLTTEECLLSAEQSRNPGFTKEDYAQVFRRYFGATNVIWLGRGIAGDDTHGHVDDLARFTDANTVVYVTEQNRADENYEPLQENLARLKRAVNQDGRLLRVETLPMPAPVWFDGQRLPASYANFYIANKIVLVPVFNDAADRIALAKLATLFPDREIVPIYCRDLVLGLGTIHCMTQQFPSVR